MSTTASRLEQILLKPNATEVSYGFIESYLLARIGEGAAAATDSGVEIAEAVDLLAACLRRAGSGWVMVIASRLSRQGVCALFDQLHMSGKRDEEIMGALYRLLDSNPVLALCNHDVIVSHLLRLLKLSSLPSPSLLRLTASVISARMPANSVVHSITARSVALLALARTSDQATACLILLAEVAQFITRDVQLLNTCLGLIKMAESTFGYDSDIRRLCKQIKDSATIEHVARQDDAVLVPVAEVKTVEPVATPLVAENEGAAVANVSVEMDHQPDSNLMDESPRSSCPSLDF